MHFQMNKFTISKANKWIIWMVIYGQRTVVNMSLAIYPFNQQRQRQQDDNISIGDKFEMKWRQIIRINRKLNIREYCKTSTRNSIRFENSGHFVCLYAAYALNHCLHKSFYVNETNEIVYAFEQVHMSKFKIANHSFINSFSFYYFFHSVSI